MSARVTATAQAQVAVTRLVNQHGQVVFFQSGGCCDGSSPICLPADAMPPGPHDRLLGTVAGARVYIDADQDDRWGNPDFLIDLAPGVPEGFSLAGPDDMHFVSVAPGGASGAPPERGA